MTKADALRRALTLLDEIESVIERVNPLAEEFDGTRRDLLRAIDAAIYAETIGSDGAPAEELTVLRVLRERWTRFLGVVERDAMQRATQPATKRAAIRRKTR